MANVLPKPPLVRTYVKMHEPWAQSKVEKIFFLFRNFWLPKFQKLPSHSLTSHFLHYVMGELGLRAEFLFKDGFTVNEQRQGVMTQEAVSAGASVEANPNTFPLSDSDVRARSGGVHLSAWARARRSARAETAPSLVGAQTSAASSATSLPRPRPFPWAGLLAGLRASRWQLGRGELLLS